MFKEIKREREKSGEKGKEERSFEASSLFLAWCCEALRVNILFLSLILCQYDKISGLYAFPKEETLSLTETPTLHFTLHTNIEENENYFKETQLFKVYEVENAQINSGLLDWQLLEDILIANTPFDATLKSGFKNLIVRIRK